MSTLKPQPRKKEMAHKIIGIRLTHKQFKRILFLSEKETRGNISEWVRRQITWGKI